MGIEQQIFGPPGTGKTTFVTRQVKNACEKYGPEEIFIASFTKAAAAELAGRDLPIGKDQIGTLHAHCYRALGRPQIAETLIPDWNECSPQFALSVGGSVDADDPAVDQTFATEGDRIFMEYQVLRAKQRPKDMWKTEVLAFAERWEEWKQSTGALDFTDMIEVALNEISVAPGAPTVGFIDEAQDMSQLELALARKWAKHMEVLTVVGDDDQCQPPDCMVLTTEGYVPIESLDPDRHRVVSYDRAASAVTGIRNGYAFKKSVRDFKGTMLTIYAGNERTRCTPEHKWIAKWTDEAKTKTHVVYLMRQGNRYRIGWCKLFRSDGIFHLGQRARIEKADAAWILQTMDTKTEASIWESYLSTKCGLPTITFEPVNGAQHLTKESIDKVFGMLENNNESRALECLRMFGLSPRHPMWSKEKAYERRGGKSIMEIEAANMISELMSIPVHQGGKVTKWMPIEIERHKYEGPVYSLDVEPHHLYIADGLVTHNCIYAFKGASVEAFLGHQVPEEHKRVLSQSHRVPRAVQELAVRWISKVSKREPKDYKPRDFEGAVHRGLKGNWKNPEPWIDDIGKIIESGQSVMFLASCSYMLEPLKAILRQNGVPFHNPYRQTRGDWNPLGGGRGTSSASRLLAYLRMRDDVWGEQARSWTPDDLQKWTEVIKAKGILRRGAKGKIDNMEGDTDPVNAEVLEEFFEEEALADVFSGDFEWFAQNLLAAKQAPMEFPLQIARKFGAKKLMERPKVILGTGHSVKGGEADVVYIIPDLSMSSMREWSGTAEQRDTIIRLFYVMMTRAKEQVVVVPPGTPYYVNLFG